jgi:signal recognition particle subunit SRP54
MANIFENLSDRIQGSLKKLTQRGKLTEKDLNTALREVKLALLEADVNYKVVKDFIGKIKERAIGVEILESLNAGQQVVKIVNEELAELMGGKSEPLMVEGMPAVLMLCGLQGAGKTTMAAKLAKKIRELGHAPLLVACDVYRPAAIQQLKVVGGQVDIPVFSIDGSQDPVKIAKESIDFARKNGRDVVILDTAGRLQIDESLMTELQDIVASTVPKEILLVVDAMTGQEAVNVAKTFEDRLHLTGVVLTKLDGDARGGAALSIRAATGKPIKYVGLGEKVDDIEVFHPDRMASRILGMGDVLSLIEKAQGAFDEKQARELQDKIRKQKFDLNDFLDQLQQLKKMGSVQDLIGMIPGMNKKQLQGAEVNEKDLVYTEAMILSMTLKERANPAIIDGKRRKRIARGSGTTVQQVNQLLKQYKEMKKMMKQMTNMQKQFKRRGKMKLPFPGR